MKEFEMKERNELSKTNEKQRRSTTFCVRSSAKTFFGLVSVEKNYASWLRFFAYLKILF